MVGVVHANRAIRGNSMGRALSIARGWRVERLQPYDLEVMDEECEFDNWINHYILLTRLLSLYICCGVGMHNVHQLLEERHNEMMRK